MALLVIPAGCCIAPLLATRNELVGGVAPPGMRTEAYTWPITSFVGGIAVGAALCGALVEGPGWRTAFVVAAALPRSALRCCCRALWSQLPRNRRACRRRGPSASLDRAAIRARSGVGVGMTSVGTVAYAVSRRVRGAVRNKTLLTRRSVARPLETHPSARSPQCAVRRRANQRPTDPVRPTEPRSVHGSMADPLAQFTPQVREWFGRAFAGPTEAQAQAWPAIATGEHVLISAPTGSGKTLAAFLYGLDRSWRSPTHEQTRLVYVSPLKALCYDVEKNLRAPLRGIGADLNVAIRTGDTPQKERRDMVKHPPDVLITTPESLYLMLTSRRAGDLRGHGDRDPGRDPRGRADQARRAPGDHAGAAGRAGGPRRPARRPVRHAEPARGGRALHGRPHSARPRSWTPACASRWT